MAQTIGQYIHSRRTDLGLSLSQLGGLCDGLDSSWVSRVERGMQRPSPGFLRRIAPALRADSATLFRLAGLLPADDRAPTPKPVDPIVERVARFVADLDAGERRWFSGRFEELRVLRRRR